MTRLSLSFLLLFLVLFPNMILGLFSFEDQKTPTIRSEFAELIEGRGVPKSCEPRLPPRSECPGDWHGLVTSHGGTGSSSVLHRATHYLTLNRDNKESLKHTPLPPIHTHEVDGKYEKPDKPDAPPVDFKRFKTIYVWGDPVSSITSLFRRKYQDKQIRQTTVRTCSLPKDQLIKRKLGSHTSLPYYLESYAELSLDYYRLNEHNLHWFFDETPYDRIFVNGELSNEVFATIPIVPLFTHPRFSTVDESDYTVQQFMDVKKIMAQNHTHKRRSDKFQFSDEMSANLRRPYQALQLFLSKLPPIFVKIGSDREIYQKANKATFTGKMVGKFIGALDMDEILDTPLPPFP